jgi:hypothetical protein
VKFGITAASAAPSVTSISTDASGTSTGTNHSTASTGGAFGGAFGVAALVVAIIYQYFKVPQLLPISVAHLLTISQAPSPSVSSDYFFWFVLPLPINFRGKTLKDAEVREHSCNISQKYSISPDHCRLGACSLGLDG